MKANPGGYIPPKDVIGRDKLIEQLWRILERQSLILCSERRMGKTSIINKMIAEAPKDKFLLIYHDLENVNAPMEFAKIVVNDVREYLSGLNKTAKRLNEFLSKIGGIEIGGVIKLSDIASSHWKDLLVNTIGDLVENQDRRVILFWDEIPTMIYNINKISGGNTAMEILNTLRSLRQTYPDFRMVFTGSIGLQNVIALIKREGSANAPVNDMNTVEVSPLSSEYSCELAQRLIEGEGIEINEPQIIAQTIAEAVGCIPYYIHHVVDQIVMRKAYRTAINQEEIAEIIDNCLTDENDPWNMSHYCERINSYYTPEEQPYALGLLDILANSDKPISFDEIFNLLKSKMVTENKEMVRNMLTSLRRDHYVSLNSDGTYQFRFPLIKRWWKTNRV